MWVPEPYTKPCQHNGRSLLLYPLLLCHILLFGCWIFSISSRCQTIWIQIRPDILSGLIWVQITRQQKSSLATKELNTKQFVDTTFPLKHWPKLISFDSNFFHLAILKNVGYNKFWVRVTLDYGKKQECPEKKHSEFARNRQKQNRYSTCHRCAVMN